jgi:hypothetical protein
LNFYSIAGSAVGNGGAVYENQLLKAGGKDEANLGGEKSISVLFAGTNPSNVSSHGALVAIAGVPSDKATGGPGIDGFTVAKYKGLTDANMQNNYGATLTNNLGALAFNPSAAHPGFEFTVKNFSKISPTLDPSQGFWVKVYAGSPADNPIGEEKSGFIHIPAPSPEKITTPEPTTWLAWSLFLGAAAYRLRRRGEK